MSFGHRTLSEVTGRQCLLLGAIGLSLGLVCMPAWPAKKQSDPYYEQAVRLSANGASLATVFELYAKSAELGNAAAQYNIAMMYSNGESVYVDYQQAAHWFRLSAGQDFPPALYRLGEMYYFGTGGLQRNLPVAIELFEFAAAMGDVDAQLNLAILAGTGEGMDLNMDKSRRWLLAASEGGNEHADRYLHILRNSAVESFTPEQKKEFWDQQREFWVQKAATMGVREAQEALRRLEAEETDTVSEP